MAKEVTAKVVEYRNGEIAAYAIKGADVRVHITESQRDSLIAQMEAEKAGKAEAA